MRSEKSKNKPKSNVKKFYIFVKPLDKDGFVDERKSGWISYVDNKICLSVLMKNAIKFEEKPKGHGSYQDWINFFKEEHPNWTFSEKPLYTT